MPTMTCWDFLDKFQMFDSSIKNIFEIYILTSAIEDFELEKTKYSMVKAFLSKPLRKATLQELDLNFDTWETLWFRLKLPEIKFLVL